MTSARWEVQCTAWCSPDMHMHLRAGWEPFAVTGQPWRGCEVWLRRAVATAPAPHPSTLPRMEGDDRDAEEGR